jgi:hypothetical protein
MKCILPSYNPPVLSEVSMHPFYAVPAAIHCLIELCKFIAISLTADSILLSLSGISVAGKVFGWRTFWGKLNQSIIYIRLVQQMQVVSSAQIAFTDLKLHSVC